MARKESKWCPGLKVESLRSNGVTQKLLAYVVNSGLLVMWYVAIPQSFAFIAFYLALGKLYANSLLGALNAGDVIFPRSRTHKTEPPSAPILTSVVVMDCDDSMLETTVDQDQDERTSGSYSSEETRVAAAFGARSSGLRGVVPHVI
ncbi:hypothetical protein BN946_scf185009.g20 [Trametes cinnabarina]|uniref:DUF6534 domain-containing protein n=1 Tax=Pycnoporus cinnabarinus TaxID=5643 RepID=A0A060SD05_PYCCI|nr:hypothetical protein BN946_scf185009.g20 [Trametes cinnabarina]